MMYNFNDLPYGWEAMWDPNTRQYFFVDHNTQSTTWRDPRKNVRNAANYNSSEDGVEIPIQKEGSTINKQNSNFLKPMHDNEQSERNHSRSASPFLICSLESISRITDDVKILENRVEAFNGVNTDKEYLFLENQLERKLLLLDSLESDGDCEIRTARKEAVKYIQSILDKLENKCKTSAKSETSVVVDSETVAGEDGANTEEPKSEVAENQS